VRYQGDQAASIEIEARWQFYGRWSVVAFGGAGRTWTERENRSSQQNVGSGGAGFRYELASKFGLHAGIDVAASPGTVAVYFVIGNAWFRP
jgi:hemolysin activation/secretion protein